MNDLIDLTIPYSSTSLIITVRSVRTLGLEWAQHSPLVVRSSPDRSTDNPDATDSERAALPQ